MTNKRNNFRPGNARFDTGPINTAVSATIVKSAGSRPRVYFDVVEEKIEDGDTLFVGDDITVEIDRKDLVDEVVVRSTIPTEVYDISKEDESAGGDEESMIDKSGSGDESDQEENLEDDLLQFQGHVSPSKMLHGLYVNYTYVHFADIPREAKIYVEDIEDRGQRSTAAVVESSEDVGQKEEFMVGYEDGIKILERQRKRGPPPVYHVQTSEGRFRENLHVDNSESGAIVETSEAHFRPRVENTE